MPSIKDTLETLAAVLDAVKVEFLVIGGFAVNHYGYSRNTVDIDVMIISDECARVRDALWQAGFTNISLHDTVMFVQRPGSTWRIDFLRTDSGTMQELLTRAECVVLAGVEVNVPALPDLIAMKLFSLAQNPVLREAKDLSDIAHLTYLNRLDLEREVKPIAMKYANEEIYQRIVVQVEALR